MALQGLVLEAQLSKVRSRGHSSPRFGLGGTALQGMVLKGMVLKGMVLQGMVLKGMVLKGMVLRGMVLRGMVLRGIMHAQRTLNPKGFGFQLALRYWLSLLLSNKETMSLCHFVRI
ncbi:hypothetical protein CC80DRAFT_505423 [Byssothecium circinans]|uniref:Uncharacterized protein n=1 Tax=Byssothecium circinans TaxID=147558 RepID=A0A6A5TT09_9PLEO|nr:hypothetical protein CC80DRAFT_505423 [Byssothecium circinans]